MNATATLACLGLGISLAVWVAYMATVPGGKVPARPVAHIALQASALVASVAALVWNARDGGSLAGLVIALAVTGMITSGLFLWLLTQRRTPVGELRVLVGGKLLPFAALTSAGEPFHTDSFAGRRVLLKFFRGQW